MTKSQGKHGAGVEIIFPANYFVALHDLESQHDILHIEENNINITKTQVSQVGESIELFATNGVIGRHNTDIQIAIGP